MATLVAHTPAVLVVGGHLPNLLQFARGPPGSAGTGTGALTEHGVAVDGAEVANHAAYRRNRGNAARLVRNASDAHVYPPESEPTADGVYDVVIEVVTTERPQRRTRPGPAAGGRAAPGPSWRTCAAGARPGAAPGRTPPRHLIVAVVGRDLYAYEAAHLTVRLATHSARADDAGAFVVHHWLTA